MDAHGESMMFLLIERHPVVLKIVASATKGALCALLLSITALRAQPTQEKREPYCMAGAQQTITGTVASLRGVGGMNWVMDILGWDSEPCDVMRIEGRGPMPTNCAAFRKFEATGQIVAEPRTQSPASVMNATSVRCF
jgi:hypothetical protein